jgi:hypothetical protein
MNNYHDLEYPEILSGDFVVLEWDEEKEEFYFRKFDPEIDMHVVGAVAVELNE